MGVIAGLYMCDVVKKSSRSLSHLLMSSCIIKLCSRLFVLYCRSRPKEDKSRHFDPHFEEVRGGVKPWWMARWKARAEFLLSVIELRFLSLTVESLQGKMCQNSLPSGVGRSLGVKISGGRCRPWGIFFGFYKTRHILLFKSGNCTVLRAVVLIQYRRVTDRQTDRRTDGIAVANTALAMGALRARCKKATHATRVVILS